MKNLLTTLSIFISTAALADSANTQGMLTDYLHHSQSIRADYEKLGLGEVKIAVASAITQKEKEVLVKTEKTYDAHSGETKLSALFGLVHFNFDGFADLFSGDFGPNSKSKTRVDYTQIITTNSEEVRIQEGAARAQLAKLKKDLAQIFLDHEYEIIEMKEQALILSQEAYQLMQAGVNIPLSATIETLNLTQEISFVGQQEVSRCVSLKHASTTASHSSDTSYSGGLNIFGLLAIQSSGETHESDIVKTYSYLDKTCQSSTNQLAVTGKDSVYWVDLQLLDQSVESWISAFEKVKMAQPESSYFPTWGSGDYEN